jgi:flagellar hook-associated protein 2
VTSSVDGLVSGLSTSSLISQLMSVEAQPQTALKTKVSTAQTAVKSYQSVNSAVAALKSAGDSLSQLSTWRAIKATSSSASVTATTSTNINAATGTLTFDVKSLATKQFSTMPVDTTLVAKGADGKVDDPIDITTDDTITVRKGVFDNAGNPTGTTTDVNVDISKDKSAAGIAKAINAANIGVTAYVMKTGDSQGVLQITGSATGTANGFTITGLDNKGLGGTSPETTWAQDATLEVSGGGTSTYTVSNSTNTFNSLMAGVSLTVSKVEDDVSVDVSNDTGSIAGKFQAMVDAANSALTEIRKQTAYDASTKTGSPLTGDFSVREMTQQILGFVSKGLSYDDPAWVRPVPDTVPPSAPDKVKFGSLSQIGMQLDSTGQITFDQSKFMAAYAKDPGSIQAAGMQFGDQVEAMGDSMSTNLSSIITGRNNQISNLNDQISDWDVRLAAKREALQKQYSDLEVSLGKLKDQSSWLSGQLAGLS